MPGPTGNYDSTIRKSLQNVAARANNPYPKHKTPMTMYEGLKEREAGMEDRLANSPPDEEGTEDLREYQPQEIADKPKYKYQGTEEWHGPAELPAQKGKKSKQYKSFDEMFDDPEARKQLDGMKM